jgi:hypothetical protein
MDKYRRTHSIVSTLSKSESSGFLPVGPPPAAPVDNKEAFHYRIVDTCRTIRSYADIFERMRRPMMRRVEACTESHGGHFEHLLQLYIFSYNLQIKCFRTRVDVDIFSCFLMWNSCSKFVLKLQLHPLYREQQESSFFRICRTRAISL